MKDLKAADSLDVRSRQRGIAAIATARAKKQVMKRSADAARLDEDTLYMDEMIEGEQLYAKARTAFAIGGDTVVKAFKALNPDLASKCPLIEREYLRFMALKCQHNDTTAKHPAKLSPPEAVDQLWHAHLLVSLRTSPWSARMLHAA